MSFFDWDLAELGKRRGWKCERPRDEAVVVRALQQGAPVAVLQHVGRRDWWQELGGWPHHFERIDDWPTDNRWEALLVIRGVGLDDLGHAVGQVLRQNRLSELAMTALAGSVRRKHEASLVEYAEERQLPFLTYAPDKLAILRGNKKSRLGVAATCEPAAMLAAGVKQVLVPKSLVGRIAIAVARRPL
jgi:hypothetical protein